MDMHIAIDDPESRITTEIIASSRDLDEVEASMDRWPECVLRYGRALLAGRAFCGDNDPAFGRWLAERGIKESKDDLAAFLNIARHPEVSLMRMKVSRRSSVRYIWEQEILPNIHVQSTMVEPDEGEESIATVAIDRPVSVCTNPPAELARIAPIKDSKRRALPVRRSFLDDLPSVDMIRAIFTDSDSRTVLGIITDKGKTVTAAWRFLVTSHTKLQTPPGHYPSVSEPNLRLVLPWLPGQMRFARGLFVTKKADREFIEEFIIPVVLANEARLKENPNELPGMVDAARRRASVQTVVARKVEASVRSMPHTEREIIFYGTRLWPLIDINTHGYDYTTLCFAIWFFQDLTQSLRISPACKTAGSLANTVRDKLRFLHEWTLLREDPGASDVRRLLGTIRQLSIIYERADGNGTVQAPPSPARVLNATPSLLSMPV